MSWIKLVEDFGLALIGIVFAAGLIEALVRIFFPQNPPLYVADAHIKTIHRKNTVATRSGPEFKITMKTNSQGFIGEDFTHERPPHTVRIAALGDSFTEGYVVDWNKAYPYLLEEELNTTTADTSFQVYNFGIAGTGTAHQLLTLRHYISAYHPDLLIWQFYVGNDYMDNLLFRAGSKSDAAPTVRFGRTRAFISKNLRAPSFILHRLAEVKNLREAMAKFSLVSSGLTTQDENRSYPFVYDIYNTGINGFTDEFPRTADLASTLLKEASEQGMRVLALVIPTKEELFPEDWHAVLEKHPKMKKEVWDLSQPRKKILERLGAEHIPTIDFLEVFKDRLTCDNARMYYRQDDHINELGHAIIAQTVAERISAIVPT